MSTFHKINIVFAAAFFAAEPKVLVETVRGEKIYRVVVSVNSQIGNLT